jgi:RHS repeat-associated core domain
MAKRGSFSTTTLYFAGGYVYSSKYKSVLKFDINIPKDTIAVTGVETMVKYLDYTSNPAGDPKIYKKSCVYDTIDTVFNFNGQLVCSGKMRIQEVGLIFNVGGGVFDSCVYVCSTGVDILTSQAVVAQSSIPVATYLNFPDPANQLLLYSYPCAETFESSSFGDGRITINTTSGDSVIYNYEYFLKDHLGSTRMVINDQGSIIEAVAYHSYGAMVGVGSYSSAMPVREKFTGKEFDQDGKDSSRGIPGIAAYHFGARVYDPEVGFWLCPDKAAQFWNKYGYTTSPIMYFDPDGNYVLGAIIGGAIGFVAGGFIGGAINDEDWSWAGAFRGMMMGASFGSGFEDALAADYFNFTPGTPRNMAQTAYGRALQMNNSNNMGMLGTSYDSENQLVKTYKIIRGQAGAPNGDQLDLDAATGEWIGQIISQKGYDPRVDGIKVLDAHDVKSFNDAVLNHNDYGDIGGIAYIGHSSNGLLHVNMRPRTPDVTFNVISSLSPKFAPDAWVGLTSCNSSSMAQFISLKWGVRAFGNTTSTIGIINGPYRLAVGSTVNFYNNGNLFRQVNYRGFDVLQSY